MSVHSEAVSGPATRAVYKALHRPLTIWGVDRRLFFLATTTGAASFNLFYSLLAGVLIFALLYAVARWATRRDPDLLRILLSTGSAKRRYDALKHERQDIEVIA